MTTKEKSSGKKPVEATSKKPTTEKNSGKKPVEKKPSRFKAFRSRAIEYAGESIEGAHDSIGGRNFILLICVLIASAVIWTRRGYDAVAGIDNGKGYAV